jgi:hypothetical protein
MGETVFVPFNRMTAVYPVMRLAHHARNSTSSVHFTTFHKVTRLFFALSGNKSLNLSISFSYYGKLDMGLMAESSRRSRPDQLDIHHIRHNIAKKKAS